MLRPATAWLLLAVLLTMLLPAGEGATCCPKCGKLGRCCCLLKQPVPPSPHCAMHGGAAACSLSRSTDYPAAMHDVQVLPDRTGTVRTLTAPPAPGLSGRVAEAGFHPPAPFLLSPPTPPPRAFRFA